MKSFVFFQTILFEFQYLKKVYFMENSRRPDLNIRDIFLDISDDGLAESELFKANIKYYTFILYKIFTAECMEYFKCAWNTRHHPARI